jgi:hypothetical protein
VAIVVSEPDGRLTVLVVAKLVLGTLRIVAW